MPARKRKSGTSEADILEQVQLPLRGLPDEEASEIVGHALRDLPGIATVTVRAAEQYVQVTYDRTRITAEAIRERMHVAGLAQPERDAGAHGPEEPTDQVPR